MIYIINENNPALVLERSTTKITRQSIHTTRKEVLKFSAGWREVTVTEHQHIANGTYFPLCQCDAHRVGLYNHCTHIV